MQLGQQTQQGVTSQKNYHLKMHMTCNSLLCLLSWPHKPIKINFKAAECGQLPQKKRSLKSYVLIYQKIKSLQLFTYE